MAVEGRDRHDIGYRLAGPVEVWVVPLNNQDGTLFGFMERHRCTDGLLTPGSLCTSNVDGRPNWTIEAGGRDDLAHLTLAPSVLCTRCGLHGYVRDGCWIPA